MEVECPYCSAEVALNRLATHVRLTDGDGHGPNGTIPDEGVDTPWQLRFDLLSAERERDLEGEGLSETLADLRLGRCPSCERGTVGTKGGDGFLSGGRRRLVCPNCGWESPEWIDVEG